MKDSRASGIDDAAFYARRSERGGPVHPSFEFASIQASRASDARPAEPAADRTARSEEDSATQAAREDVSPRRSMASPVPRARRTKPSPPTPADDFISRLAAAEQRLKHAADGARE